MKKQSTDITELVVQGMRGRVLQLDAKNSSDKSILLVYGIHSSIERMYGTAQFLSRYGTVTLPDLPGLGGMDSFYSARILPSLDAYATYLYEFIQLKKLHNQKLTVVAMSFGFMVVTRMLQMYPDSQAWIDDVISFGGFGRTSDFRNAERSKRVNVPVTRILRTRLASEAVRFGVFNNVSLSAMFAFFQLFNPKYKHGVATNRAASLAMERQLWQKNDARTRFFLYHLLFTFDLTGKELITVPLHDMTTPVDQYFDAKRVSKTLRLLYKEVYTSRANMELHAPSILGDEDAIAEIFSDDVKRVLANELYT